ncbi:GntR family transcriptional regulator YhfZ [Rickettsiales bacterium LUAb2]
MLTKGLLKVSYLKKKLATEFLNYKSGDFIETISKYQEKFNASRGSVQIALKELQVEKVITLHSKGASGTQVVKLDYDSLLEILDINAIIGSMPLPYSSRYEGLASSFVQSFKQAPFRFAWSYRRGSLNRVQGLMNDGYDFIILSQMAAKYYQSIYDFKILTELEDNSYSSKHVWVVKKGITEIKDGMKIGLDKASFDQFFLTNKAVTNLKVDFVDVTFPNVVKDILNGNIDAVIWSQDMLEAFNNTNEIDTLVLNEVEEYERAVIVAKKDRGDVAKIVRDYIKINKIKEHQDQVINKKLIPIL